MRTRSLFFSICLILSNIPFSGAQTWESVFDPSLLNWIKFNVSPITQLPYSFYVAPQDTDQVYQHMEKQGALDGTIERMITHEGMSIYDAALYQIVLSQTGNPQDLGRATLADDYYWRGSVGDNWNIRAGYPINTFIYNPKNPQSVTSDLTSVGKRGFIFRILDADGKFLTTDPLDGKSHLTGFPEYDRLHWVDWKPVAGENAWVVIGAMQLYHKKYFDVNAQEFLSQPDSVELKLSKELARAAIILQSDCGGIRMAPWGTHRNLKGDDKKYFNEKDWWYEHISTENNISWYGAFRMLYVVTHDPQYKKAMDGIKKYLQFVWDKKQGMFYQGVCFKNGHWAYTAENFALDVQTCSIAGIGPRSLDAWFGQGTAWRIWQSGRLHAGVFDKKGHLIGVGFTDEHDRITVEWSAEAMVALNEIVNYYKIQAPQIASEALKDKLSMRQSMEGLHCRISGDLAAYSYSSRRGEIPFGWNSHDPQVLSLASTSWMIFVDAGFNPFRLL